MTPVQVVFIVAAVVTLASAFLVVTSRKMLHAALWLVLSLFGVAMLFALLEAGFFAVVQVVVYIGAIAILIIFAVMLTRRVMEDVGPQVNRTWWIAALVVVGLLVGLVAMFSHWSGFNAALPEYTRQVQSQNHRAARAGAGIAIRVCASFRGSLRAAPGSPDRSDLYCLGEEIMSGAAFIRVWFGRQA